MLKGLTPFYNVDGDIGSDSGDSWASLAQGAMTEESPVDDVQPEEDTDTEALETADETDAEADTEPTDEATETPAFDDETEVDLGEGRQPVKLAELKQGYLRQSDYTKKTQELSNQRKEIEALQQEMAPTKEWHDYISANPWLFQQINAAIQEFQSTGVLPLDEVLADAQHGQYINHLMHENATLKKELDGLRGEYEGVKLTSEMTRLQSELKADYGDLVTEEYMNTLQERGKAEKLSAATLKDIAEGHLSKQKLQQAQQSTKKQAAKAVQSLAETRKNLPPQPGTHAQVPSKQAPDLSSMSWLDLAKSTRN